ncbi:MAG: arginase family protein, partial [Planctomycetes bacterium]|nr:arginase family protein [Planctomycetota bacterium]
MVSRRFNRLQDDQEVHILGVPMDHGAGRRGVGMGPSAIRIAGLHEKLKALGLAFVDHGDVLIRDVERAQKAISIEGKANHLPMIARACDAAHEHIKRIVKKDAFPLVIGGDHSIAIGTIAGLVAAYKEEEAELRKDNPKLELTMGVIWIDAHGDLNTPLTSPSGNIHGMP